MEQYNYYPAQSGHPPPNVANQQHAGAPMQQQQPPQGGQMIHGPMPPQNIRQQNMPIGPPNHLQQMQQIQQQHQQHQHIGHHTQQHPQSYQIQPHPHGPPVSHSGSPHLQQQQQQQHHNHQQTLSGPPQQQQAISSQQHHMHPQSPHHHGGPPQMHMQQQQINQMVRPPMGPSVINHPQSSGMQHHPHQNNFFNGGGNGPMPQPTVHHYHQQNQHHQAPPPPPPQQQQPHHHHHHHHHHQQQQHQHTMIHHGPSMSAHQIHAQQHNMGRNSPYHPSILQTEFRIIELNRRLQCRPISRHPVSPLPTNTFDESIWWEKFASDFFEDDATLTLRSMQDDKPVEYKIGRTLIPRYFRTYFDGGVTDLSINLRNPKEACLQPQLITLDCDHASIVTSNIFKHPALPPNNHGIVVHTDGHLILDFVNNSYDTLSIKSWRFYTRTCREYIDRSVTTLTPMPNALLIEPVTRQQGLTKSTITYLKMCMIMEPMQDLMFLHRQTKATPKECLNKILVEKYKYKSDDNKATNKRRKRKPSAAPAVSTNAIVSGPNKKSKTSLHNSMCNNSGMNNMMMSPSGPASFSLASQDVMVVGEPSMMGGDFGDDNERMITRLENTQYDPNASTPSNVEESDSLNTSAGNEVGIANNIELNIDNHNLSPSLLQQNQQHLQLQQSAMSQDQVEQTLPNQDGSEQSQQPDQRLQINSQDQEANLDQMNTIENLIEENDEDEALRQQLVQHSVDLNHSQENSTEENSAGAVSNSPKDDKSAVHSDLQEQLLSEPQQNQQQSIQQQSNEDSDESKLNSITEPIGDSNLMLGINSVEMMEDHTNNSIQALNEESNSNSQQLPCSTASATSAIEQQQPVDNGVA